MIKLPTRAALLLVFVFQAHAAMAVTVPSASFPSIQSAINAVVSGALPNGTVIDVNPGLYTEFLLVNATAKSMTVRGAGPASTMVKSPGGAQSVLRVLNATGAVRFEGLTLQQGTGTNGQGGGFTLQDSSPTFFNCAFLSNSAPSGGGGVLTRSNATFDTVLFQNNSAGAAGGGIVITVGSRPLFISAQFVANTSGTTSPTGSGGAVHANDSSPTFRNSTFYSNRSNFAGGAVVVIGNFGGTTATLVLEDSTVSNNTSVQVAGQNPSEGGGVHIEDNAIAYVTRTRVAGNTAHTGGGLSTYRARYEIAHSIIEGNAATGGASGPVAGGYGGGIDATSNNVSGPIQQASTVILHDTAVRNNTAVIGAGILIVGDHVCSGGTCNGSTATKATLRMTETLFDNNRASSQGGGIAADLSTVVIDQSHILRNTTAASYGGGLFVIGSTQATITNTTIAKNTSASFGGGIFLDTGAVLNVDGSRIYQNAAGGAAYGGGIYVNGQGPPSGTISNSFIVDNTNYQIGEQACTPAGTPLMTYTGNTILPEGSTAIYNPTCGAQPSTVAVFNALPKTSANNNSTPIFSSFMATPGVGPTSVLSWVAARPSAVAVSNAGPVSSVNGVGVKDVTPSARTTYTMTASPDPTLSAEVTALVEWGVASDYPVPADYDGDGKIDIAVYRPSTGQWFIVRSSGGTISQAWGVASLGDMPVPADYDGDGKADIAVYRQTTGEWFIIGSTAGVSGLKWGEPSLGDVPVPGDYDGDGKANLAIYRTSNGQWFARQTNGGVIARNWGVPAAGDQPVPADYNGDGVTDFAVYRTSNGLWFVLSPTGATMTFNWGVPSLQDVPRPADYDGDGLADPAVIRLTTGQWFVLNSSGGSQAEQWGSGSFRLPGDYDFNHVDDFAVFTASGRWAIRR